MALTSETDVLAADSAASECGATAMPRMPQGALFTVIAFSNFRKTSSPASVPCERQGSIARVSVCVFGDDWTN